MFGIGQSLRRKPRQFNYNPRYYDAEQEARNQRRIELGHAPREAEGVERKPGDILRARSERRQQEAERNMASRRQRGKTRMLLVAVLIIGMVLLTRSIIETFNF